MYTLREGASIFVIGLIFGAIIISTSLGEGNDEQSDPKSVTVIEVPSAADSVVRRTGNVSVTYADGHSKSITSEGNCMSPKISRDKKIGWVRVDKSDVDLFKEIRRGIDAVVVLMQGGETKQFLPDSEAPFIGRWQFAKGGKCVAIESSSYHGPRHYSLHDIETAKVLESIEDYVPNKQLPAWARSLVNE
jgi:hypothetical protein